MRAFVFGLGACTLAFGIGFVAHALNSLRNGCRHRVDRLQQQFPGYGNLRWLAYWEAAGQIFCALCLIAMGAFLVTVVCADW